MLGTLVLYRTAGLGDFAKTWPLLRSLYHVTIVTDSPRGALANAVLGVPHVPIEQWHGCFRGESSAPKYVRDFHKVIIYRHEVFAHKDADLKDRIQDVAPNVKIDSRNFHPQACAGTGPPQNLFYVRDVLFHVGAGLLKFDEKDRPPFPPVKAWDVGRSVEFAELLKGAGHAPTLVAGPAQVEQWDDQEKRLFSDAGGVFGNDITELACRILCARWFIGFDSGPTHLAAQLGKPTVALFGPTGARGISDIPDMVYAEPIGPLVEVIYPPMCVEDSVKSGMAWLDPAEALQLVLDAYSKMTSVL